VVFGQARGVEDDLDAEARAEDGRVGDEPFNKLVVDIDWDGRSWDINGQFSGAVGEQLDARVRIGEDGELEIRADTVEWRLENLSRPAALGLGGRSALHARLNGPAGKLRGDVELVVDDLRVGGIETGAAKLRAEATDGAWAIAGGALNGNLELTGDIDASGELPFSLQASWREIDLAAMLGAEPDLLARASGSLSVEGALRRPQEIVGEMQLASLRIGSGDEVFETEAPIVVRLRNAEVSVDTFALQSRYARLDGDGRIDFDGRLEASLAGDLALEWLELWIGDPIDSAHGEIEFDVDVRRSPDGVLDLAGKARIEEGAVDIAGEISATGLKGSFSFVDDSVEVHGLSGELSGGAFSVAGTIDQRTGPALTWEVVEVGLTPVRSMEVELSGIGELKGAWDAVLLSGDVRILQLLYDRDLEFADLIPSFDRALAPADRATEERRPPLGLDLRFRARDSILIDNSLARLEAAADIRVGGTARAPQLNGQIHIADGAIFLRGRTFEVTSGSLTFRPTLGNVAAIDFSAESVIDTADESYAVSVRVSGYSDNFRVLLASDDGSLSSTDIASLITFGKTVTQLQQSEGSDEGGAVAGLVNFATDRVAGVLAGEAEYALPIDRVEFRPEYSPVTGQFEPQVRFGKYLTDDLSAWLGQSFGVEARTTVEADYRLSRRLSTFLSWESETTNESGAFGGGFRNRIDFWSLPRFFFFGRSEAVEKEGPG
jgi:autotransporter translocation and assembly factor TamB